MKTLTVALTAEEIGEVAHIDPTVTEDILDSV